MSRVRVAGVGAGYFSQFHLRGWRAIAETQFVVWCDRDASKVKGVAAFDSVERMLERSKPHLLDILTPPEAHRALVAEALARKLPAICQKAARAELCRGARDDRACRAGGRAARGARELPLHALAPREETGHRFDGGPLDTFGGGACEHLQRHVVRHLRESTPLENTARDYLANLRIQEAVYRSHAEGRRIQIGARA